MAVCRIACFRGPIRKSDTEIGFGPRRTLESLCALLRDWSVMIKELRYSAVSGWLWAVAVCGRGGSRGLNLESGAKIGFGPTSGPRPVWRLAGRGPGTAGFRRFRIGVCCFRSSLRWCSWTGSEIGCRIRNRSARGMRTFCRVWQGVAEYCGSRVMRAGFAYDVGRVGGLI